MHQIVLPLLMVSCTLIIRTSNGLYLANDLIHDTRDSYETRFASSQETYFKVPPHYDYYNARGYKKGRPYSFGYGVLDKYAGLAFGHNQNSDGQRVTGSYDTLLPDGRVQIVTYIADENGYRANVRYEDSGHPKKTVFHPKVPLHHSFEIDDDHHHVLPSVAFRPHTPFKYHLSRAPLYLRRFHY